MKGASSGTMSAGDLAERRRAVPEDPPHVVARQAHFLSVLDKDPQAQRIGIRDHVPAHGGKPPGESHHVVLYGFSPRRQRQERSYLVDAGGLLPGLHEQGELVLRQRNFLQKKLFGLEVEKPRLRWAPRTSSQPTDGGRRRGGLLLRSAPARHGSRPACPRRRRNRRASGCRRSGSAPCRSGRAGCAAPGSRRPSRLCRSAQVAGAVIAHVGTDDRPQARVMAASAPPHAPDQTRCIWPKIEPPRVALSNAAQAVMTRRRGRRWRRSGRSMRRRSCRRPGIGCPKLPVGPCPHYNGPADGKI